MKKFFKRFLQTCLSAAVFALAFSAFTGCSDAEQKYDVSIKVVNNYGQEWIFTPDIDELYYEFEYTGEEMTFGVESYNLPDHPEWGDTWIRASGEGANVFEGNYLFTDVNGNQSNTRIVKERGQYVISYSASPTSDLWNYRSVSLYVTVI